MLHNLCNLTQSGWCWSVTTYHTWHYELLYEHIIVNIHTIQHQLNNGWYSFNLPCRDLCTAGACGHVITNHRIEWDVINYSQPRLPHFTTWQIIETLYQTTWYSEKQLLIHTLYSLIARFMRPTWGPSGADRTQVGPMLASWTWLSR